MGCPASRLMEMIAQQGTPITPATCPVCAATDAYIDKFLDGDEYYVECVNCKVYRATRRAFRHFEYLRAKGDRDGLARLARLAAALHARGRGSTARLEYDTWEELV
jgi:Zn ribbon nucleic-acid-binding protein